DGGGCSGVSADIARRLAIGNIRGRAGVSCFHLAGGRLPDLGQLDVVESSHENAILSFLLVQRFDLRRAGRRRLRELAGSPDYLSTAFTGLLDLDRSTCPVVVWLIVFWLAGAIWQSFS